MINNLTLLYVEDEEIVRENFTEIFKMYFSNILTADNGVDGLKIYEENEIDIAILDISIPQMNGLSLAQKIRENDKEIEIIMLTGHAEKDKLLKAINLHLFSYLVKPVRKEPLDATLKSLIQKLSKKTTINFTNSYSFNTKAQTLFYKDKAIKVSKKELQLVNFLSKNLNTYFSACDILENLKEATNLNDLGCNNIIQLISRFKKKMLDLHQTEHFFIDNIYGLGYSIRKN